eukprot:s2810_g6.t1
MAGKMESMQCICKASVSKHPLTLDALFSFHPKSHKSYCWKMLMRRDRQQARAVANELATAFESLSLVSLTQALNARLPSHRMSIYESQFGIDITAPDGVPEVAVLPGIRAGSVLGEPTGVSFAQPRARIASAVLCVAAAALA